MRLKASTRARSWPGVPNGAAPDGIGMAEREISDRFHRAMLGRRRRWLPAVLLLLVSGCVGQATQPTPPSNPPAFGGTAASEASGWPTYHRDLSRSGHDATS